MSDVKITIDGAETVGRDGMTIVQAAEQQGVDIPTLCHIPDVAPEGVCRVCVVEVEGSRALVGSCHTPIAPGMVVHTRSPRVLASRKATVELLLASHTGDCVTDTNARSCALHNLASDLEVGPPRFRVRQPRRHPVEEGNPYVGRDLSKCILCRKCIGACNQMVGQKLFSVGYRGVRSKIVVGCDESLNNEACRDCGVCIDQCPTGALFKPAGVSFDKKDKAAAGTNGASDERAREDLLNRLKQAQAGDGCVSQDAMKRIAGETGLPLNEIYGVATFYSFLSTEPLGRNVVRVCSNVSCSMSDAGMIVQSVKKEIGIAPGETTSDRRYSLELTNCIGACDMAPAMMVNSDVHGHLTAVKISDVLKSYE
jgi:NADH:ubiquinone oxidoreductase subunit E/NAD-dependent dihydropyrimidine dehydrogenase PreA subunit